MAVTRYGQAGAESNLAGSAVNLGEFDLCNGFAASTGAGAKTGSGYFLGNNTGNYGEWQPPATRQMQTGFHLNSPAIIAAEITFFSVRDGAGNVLLSLTANIGGDIKLYVGGVLRDTAAGALPVNSYRHYGVNWKIDAVAGWAYVYQDGVEILSFDGNTGNADVRSVRYHNFLGLSGGWWDDLFLDDTTGEAGPALVPDYRFYYITPNAVGNYNELTPSAAVNHYTLVDERPHTSDTDYCEADALNERDTYGMTTFVLPAGWIINAITPFGYIKKLDAGVATQVALMLRENATDWQGADQDLSTSYQGYWERRTTAPDGGAWTQAKLDALEVGLRGRGAF